MQLVTDLTEVKVGATLVFCFALVGFRPTPGIFLVSIA